MLSSVRFHLLKNLRNRYFLVSDLVLLPLAAYLSFALRLDALSLGLYLQSFVVFGLLVMLAAPVVLWRAGVYSRYWRYASVEEVLLLAGAVAVIDIAASAVGLLVFPLLPFTLPLPRSVPFIFFFLGLTAVAVPRYMVRLTARSSRRERAEAQGGAGEIQSVLIMGAGDAGAMIVRELKSNPQLGIDPVGFIDDDLGKHDVRIHGVPVLGDRHAIPDVARAL